MADIITGKPKLKEYFQTAKKPTEDQFAAWMDSYWHKNEAIDITSINKLSETLDSKATTTSVNSLSTQLATLSTSTTGKQDCSPKDNVRYVLYNGRLLELKYSTDSSYEALKTLKSSSSLTPGMWYAFNFKSIYVQPNTNIVMGLQGQTNELGQDVSSLQYYMLILATSPITFSKNVKIISVYDDTNNATHDYTNYCNQWTVEYMFDNDTTQCAWIDADQSMGAITRLIDHKGNESYYDHLNIRFRVYAIDTTNLQTYVSTNTYKTYSDLVWYNSNKNTIAYFPYNSMPVLIMGINANDTTSKYQSFSSSSIVRSVHNLPLSIPVIADDYIDRVTFNSKCFYNCLSKLDNTDLNPNIFNNSNNIKLPGYSSYNIFTDSYFVEFLLPNNFNNIFYNSFQCIFAYDADSNAIINSYNINTQQGFGNNNISYGSRISCQHECTSVQLFNSTDIDFKDEAYDIFAYNCNQVSFESNCNSITLKQSTRNLSVRQNVSNLDLSLSTQMDSDKSKEIIMDEDGVCRLLYYGNNGVAQLTSPTA